MLSCTCDKCVGACRSKPGWFLPGEPEILANYLGISLKDLFTTSLIVDWWVGNIDEPDIFLLAPATTISGAGKEAPYNPMGQCIFLDSNNRCRIYPARPHECSQYIHTQNNSEIDDRHKATAWAWQKHQEQIENLLGRSPSATSPSFGWMSKYYG